MVTFSNNSFLGFHNGIPVITISIWRFFEILREKVLLRLFARSGSYCLWIVLGTAPCGFAGAANLSFVPVTAAMLHNPDKADWPSFRRTTNSWGFSPLMQVTRDNVKELALVWSRPMADGIQESAPLVYDGVMYLPNPGDVTQAIDAETGKLLWEHRREMPADLTDYIRFPSLNRNLAIYGNLIFDNSADDYLYALDARSGDLAWESQIVDYRTSPSMQSSGPIIANGKVVSGRGCEANTGPDACVITAHDAATGKEIWRTGTIDPENNPEDSWGGYPRSKRSHVGSWYVPSYDPALNLIYVGTSVTWPAPKFVFGETDKQYLYHNSTLALKADTGEIEWYYQHVVDHWDLDHTFERVLDDLTVAPDPEAVSWINPELRPAEQRKVVTGIPGKTGIVYTLDRETGEFLWATPTVRQNVVENIDGRTGGVTVNPDLVYDEVGDSGLVCPGSTGGKNWPAGSYNPETRVMFQPLQNACMQVTVLSDDPEFPEGYGLLRESGLSPETTDLGSIYAISAETGLTVWKVEQRAATASLMATASGLLFGGDSNGYFRAYDQSTGEVLWEVYLGSRVTGFPVAFAVDGRQYVAVSTGSALLTGQFLAMTPELKPGDINQMFVFAIPRRAASAE